MGYHKFLYISELLTNTCDDCEGKHGSLFTIKDVEQGVISLPLHRNCKCTLIAIDQTSEIEYNLDRGLFLKWVMKQAQKLNGGIYKLEEGIVAPVVECEQPKISSSLPQQSWLDRLKKWADEFSDDASAAWDSVLAASMKRALAHIMDTHGVDFINKEIYDVPQFIKELIEAKPAYIGRKPSGPYAVYSVNGSDFMLAHGDNGFVVSCYPYNGSK